MAQTIAPNQYEIRGRGVRVDYSTSGIAGNAQLNISRHRKTLTFTGDQIGVVPLNIGELITVTLSATPDQGATHFSFLIPRIQLAKQSSRQSFRTVGLVTEEKTTIAGPPNGVQQTYKSVQLRGSARQVQSFAKNTQAA